MKGISFAILLCFVIGISVFATLYEPGAKAVKDMFFSISELGLVGYLLIVLVQAATVVCAIPIIIPNLALSTLYCFPVAFSLSMIGYTVGVGVIYGFMFTCKWEPDKTFAQLHSVMRQRPFKYSLLVRFIMMPAALKNYGLAGCPVTFWVYLVCADIHGAYVNGLQIATAAQLWSASSALSYITLAFTLTVGVGSLILFSYLAHRAIRSAQSEQLLADNHIDT